MATSMTLSGKFEMIRIAQTKEREPGEITWHEFNNACRNLGRYVEMKAATIAREIGISYAESESCPTTGREISATFEQCRRAVKPFPVYSGGCANTIYPIAADNLAFRFWHDFLHWRHGATIKTADEIRLAKIHARQVGQHFGRDSIEARVIYADIAGQVEYYASAGEYLKDQKGFVFYYINANKNAGIF